MYTGFIKSAAKYIYFCVISGSIDCLRIKGAIKYMKYTIMCDSDIGKSRSMNQDAVAIKHISTSDEEIVFAVLCDGMGGFNEGEIASCSVLKAFMKWFDIKFTKNIARYDDNRICEEWKSVIEIINDKLYRYGKSKKITLGTTVTVMLLKNTNYYILNIGDCRAYELSDTIRQLTRDHSVVAQEVLEGKLTEEEARYDNRRNQLLKSVGVLSEVTPDFFCGKVNGGSVYMMCCDGVRNKVFDDELLYYFHPAIMTNKSNMKNNIDYIFSLNKERGENDNMTVVLIKDNETTVVLNNTDDGLNINDEKIIINSDAYIDIEMEA